MRNYSYSQIFAIAYPILFSTMMEQLIGMTDTAFLGRVGEIELGASALGNIFYMTIFMLGMGFSVGACFGMIFRLCLAQTVVHYLLFYVGLAHTSGVRGSILTGSNVFFSILISSLICHYETLGRAKLAGCVLGFGGVVLINLDGTGLGGGVSFLGEGFMLLSALSSSVSSVLIKSYSQRENPVTLSGSQFLLGGLIMTATGLAFGGRLTGFTPASVLLLVYLALISAVAYSLWSILLKHNPVGRVAVFGFLTPVCGVILSALILGEQNQAFTLQGLGALVLVSLGIFLVNASSAPAAGRS